MNKKLLANLLESPKPIVTGAQLTILLGNTADARQSIIRQAIREGFLVRLRRDFFLIQLPGKEAPVDSFEISTLLYGPSYVSFESALQFHGWIPEAVYTTTCATTKKAKNFDTPLGLFAYKHIPIEAFHMGLTKTFVATPWKAVADLIYVQKRSWKSMTDFCGDMRVEEDSIKESDLELLKYLSEHYPNEFTQHSLKRLLQHEH
ncbi:MAG: hypothetical protein JKY15_00895 [Deltaproteobacteria bacterium]|nr:hypothetical protein [Deltaproteobacteria bacterium]